jgi:hypothetical protein
LKRAYGDQDDYVKGDKEHTLNHGNWHWMNFIEKGEKKREAFAKYCPVTTQILEESVGEY